MLIIDEFRNLKLTLIDLNMKKEVFLEWLVSLRSGSYLQGKNWLKQQLMKDHVEHCCLGVLGEVLEKRGKIQWSLEKDLYQIETLLGGTSKTSIPTIIGPSTTLQNLLQEYNDHGNISFSEIAQALEDYFLPMYNDEPQRDT